MKKTYTKTQENSSENKGATPHNRGIVTSCERYFFTAALIFFSIGMSCDIGVYGLSVMGSNLALNIASKGFNVAVSNRSVERVPLSCCNLICR